MKHLNEFELEVLENLPFEPIGLSLAELADGLLDDRSPQAKGRIMLALKAIRRRVGGLWITRGDDDFGACQVKMYGLPREKATAVRLRCSVEGK